MLFFRKESSTMTPRVRIEPNRVSLARAGRGEGSGPHGVFPQPPGCSILRLLRTGRQSRVQQLFWLAAFAGPLGCSVYDDGLGPPRQQEERDGAGGAGSRGSTTTGSAGSGRGGAGGEDDPEAGSDPDGGEIDGGGAGGTAGSGGGGGTGGAAGSGTGGDGGPGGSGPGDGSAGADVDAAWADAAVPDTGAGGGPTSDVRADGARGDADVSLADTVAIDVTPHRSTP